MNQQLKVAIAGGGICGLALALNLHRRGIECRVYERVPEIMPLGVGITLLPHAMRELTALGLGDEMFAAGIENRASSFFNRFGQLVYTELCGKFAGYDVPEVGIHAGNCTLSSQMKFAIGSVLMPYEPITNAPASSRTRTASRSISTRPKSGQRLTSLCADG